MTKRARPGDSGVVRGRTFLGAVALACTAGCTGSSFVEGTLQLGEATGFEFAEVRAFPEYPDGFNVRRIYTGDEVLLQSIRIDNADVPATFRLEGYDIGDPGGPWRVLAWLTNREDSEWVGTNERYGTRTFVFDCSNGPVCAIRGVSIDIDTVAPPN